MSADADAQSHNATSSRRTARWAVRGGTGRLRLVRGLFTDVRRVAAIARWRGPADAPAAEPFTRPREPRIGRVVAQLAPATPGVRLAGPAPARLPAGPVILIANHPTPAAAGYVLSRLGRERRGRTVLVAAPRERVGALTGLNRPVVRIDVAKPGRAGVRLCDLLGRGWSALIFPEGVPTAGATRRPYHSFAADLAHQTGIPVVPVGIRGARAVGATPGPSRVSVRFGDPLHADADARDQEAAVNGLIAEDQATWWVVQRSAPGQLPGTRTPEAAHNWRHVWAQTAPPHQGGRSESTRIWH